MSCHREFWELQFFSLQFIRRVVLFKFLYFKQYFTVTVNVQLDLLQVFTLVRELLLGFLPYHFTVFYCSNYDLFNFTVCSLLLKVYPVIFVGYRDLELPVRIRTLPVVFNTESLSGRNQVLL